MSLRIAFCGASGTGKSTLAEYVRDKYRLEANPIGSRSVARAMGFDSPYDVDKVGRRAEFQNRLMREKCAWEACRNTFVTDRTVLDNLAYLALHDIAAVTYNVWRLMVVGMQHYTHIFFCPIGAVFNLGDDPMRVKNIEYHRIYELIVEGAMHKLRYNVIRLEAETLEDRKACIDRAIAKLEKESAQP